MTQIFLGGVLVGFFATCIVACIVELWLTRPVKSRLELPGDRVWRGK